MIEARFYETYYFCNVVRNVLHDSFEFNTNFFAATFQFGNRTSLSTQSKVECESKEVKDVTLPAIVPVKSNSVCLFFVELKFVLCHS